MSCNQLLPEDTSGVVADSFFAPSLLQHMSRRHIMSLSSKLAGIGGFASNSLFGTASTDRVVLKQGKNVSTTVVLYMEDWQCSIIEFPQDNYPSCDYTDPPIRATA